MLASGIILLAMSAFKVIVSVAASPSVISPFAVISPVATMSPVTLSCVAVRVIFSLPAISKRIVSSLLPSSTWICVSPSVSAIAVTVVLVVNLRTSIVSPLSGASSSVIVLLPVPLSAYALVSCETPLINTRIPAAE